MKSKVVTVICALFARCMILIGILVEGNEEASYDTRGAYGVGGCSGGGY